LCSKVVNSIIKLTADKNGTVFNVNVEILASLLLKWKTIVVIDKDVICKMLNISESVDGGHLWKMTAI